MPETTFTHKTIEILTFWRIPLVIETTFTYNTNEILASMLISLHNVNFYQEFMKRIRTEIKEGTFSAFYKKYIRMYN